MCMVRSKYKYETRWTPNRGKVGDLDNLSRYMAEYRYETPWIPSFSS
jgi:hypothetical protein